MIDLEDTFIIDSIAHARNLSPENVKIPSEAEPLIKMMVQGSRNLEEGPILTEESIRRDWKIEDTAKLIFTEGYTDMATYHPTPIAAFEDGFSALEKAEEAINRWPNRFNVMATIDPLLGEEALKNLEEQVEMLDPIGLKMYPYGWSKGKAETWRMDDPNIAYPVIEKAKELGLDFIAVHKAVPLGQAPVAGADPGDMDITAKSFPEIDFCIVHGGLSFLEQTGWQLARFDNLYVDLEGAANLLVNRQKRFAKILSGLVERGGEEVFDRIFWGSGIPPRVHPKIQYEAFAEFEMPKDVKREYGVSIRDEHKEKMLGLNYADLIGIDPEEQLKTTKDDVFDGLKPEVGGLAKPYTTIEEVEVERWA